MKMDSSAIARLKSSEPLTFLNFLPGDTFLRTEMMVLPALPFRESIPLSARYSKKTAITALNRLLGAFLTTRGG